MASSRLVKKKEKKNDAKSRPANGKQPICLNNFAECRRIPGKRKWAEKKKKTKNKHTDEPGRGQNAFTAG